MVAGVGEKISRYIEEERMKRKFSDVDDAIGRLNGKRIPKDVLKKFSYEQ
jgi:predicted nucleic acid-binding OB-fold protein